MYSGFAAWYQDLSIQNLIKDHILATRCQTIILIHLFFSSIGIADYNIAMTVLELKVDQLFEFLDATNISYIFTKMLPLDTSSYLSKILSRIAHWQLCSVIIFILISFSCHKYSKLSGLLFSFSNSFC